MQKLEKKRRRRGGVLLENFESQSLSLVKSATSAHSTGSVLLFREVFRVAKYWCTIAGVSALTVNVADNW